MAIDERTLFSNLRKQRDALAKSKLAAQDRDALQKEVDAFLVEAGKVVVVHGELMNKLRAQQAERKALDAKDKALAATAKAFPGKLAAAMKKKNDAIKALAAARNKPGRRRRASSTHRYDPGPADAMDGSITVPGPGGLVAVGRLRNVPDCRPSGRTGGCIF